MIRSLLPQACRCLVTILLVLSLLPIEASGVEPTAFDLEQQWHLKARTDEPAGANVRAIWPTTQGAGVVIGIVDDGLQHTHPDLSPNYSSALSHDFNFNDSDPSPTTSGSCETFPGADCHGTAVAGAAGAGGVPGGTGVSGAAPLASLAGLRLIAGPITDADEAAAFSHEPDAIHILSNSWGPSDNPRILDGPGPLAEAARATAATTGRGGKGRIFVFAAGNGGDGPFPDNCNFDGYANSRYVIAVGALDDSANQAFYSEPCSALFVTAPSSGGTRSITTTDLVGTMGYNPAASLSGGDYTSTFGGTSSAAPLVSGAVALMLAQNPSLSWRDVQHVLRKTAFRVNPLDAGWTVGAFPHNEKFGFGLIDAQAAVNLAATWINVAAEDAIPPVTNTVNVAIPDNNPAGPTDGIVIGSEFADFTVEHVEVIFNATHPFRGDLAVTLTSPSGVVSQLATVRVDPGDNFSSWRFGTVRHWGESAQGSWTLKVVDGAPVDIGTWISWTLQIYGRAGTDPDPLISVTPGSQNFGSVAAGNSADRTFTVQNIGGGTLTGSATTSDPFSIFSGGSFSLGPGDSQSVVVRFSPVGGTTFTGTVGITSNGGNVSPAVTGTVPLLTLSVNKSGTGRGTVTSNPLGIFCGAGCTGGFVGGTSVALRARAARGSVFSGWSGCDSVSDNTCTVTMNGSRAVTATFLARPKITGFTPASGRVGRRVKIFGSHLAGATEVRFNGTNAGAPTTVSTTLIVTTVPLGATTGPISVTTPAGTATSMDSFRVKP
jgi:subtilisin-like proprotein convertase family protein